MPFSPSDFLKLGEAPPIETTLKCGMVVLVKHFSAGDRDFLESYRVNGKIPDFRARWLQRILCNPDGSLAFAEGDIPKLAKIPEETWDEIMEKSATSNGVTQEAIAEAVGESPAG